MAKKTSATQKANYVRYNTECRAETNKKIKVARHMKKHPNDAQSAARKPGARAGMSHERVNPVITAMERAAKHDAQFNAK